MGVGIFRYHRSLAIAAAKKKEAEAARLAEEARLAQFAEMKARVKKSKDDTALKSVNEDMEHKAK